jgi:hypothetical protein
MTHEQRKQQDQRDTRILTTLFLFCWTVSALLILSMNYTKG